MSDQPQQPKAAASGNFQVILFVAILSLVCALILSTLASALSQPQEVAKEIDRSEQMLIAANLMNHAGNFLMKDEEGNTIVAKYAGDGKFVPGSARDYASQQEILDVYKARLKPFLVDSEGERTTFEKAGINMEEYLVNYRKAGYYKQPYKLIYEILPNPSEKAEDAEQSSDAAGYVIPVNGYGLWDAIYGYIAIQPDGETVIGISWYDQKETPGLGANIADAPWQEQFHGKKIFQPNPDGQTDFQTAPIGITVVKGRVMDALGTSPKAQAAVDGMPGATLTGTGVTEAYRNVLSAYRPFFMKLQQKEGQ